MWIITPYLLMKLVYPSHLVKPNGPFGYQLPQAWVFWYSSLGSTNLAQDNAMGAKKLMMWTGPPHLTIRIVMDQTLFDMEQCENSSKGKMFMAYRLTHGLFKPRLKSKWFMQIWVGYPSILSNITN